MNRSETVAAGTFRSRWPLIVSSLFFLSILAVLIALAVRACQGHFGYPLDDTYIHMAMAKNFVLHRVWGITRYEFSSSTSSPLYTLLLAACYAVTGIREITPLILNIVAGLLLLSFADFLLAKQRIPPVVRFLLLCFIVLAVPVPTLVYVGMEHVLHALLMLIFVHLCATYLADRRRRAAAPWFVLFTLTVILVLTRYEAVFAIGIAGLLFLAQKRWPITLALAFSSLAPIAVYGWISMSHGWFAIPNSLLLKANTPGFQFTGLFGTFFHTLYGNLSWGFHIVVFALIAAILIYAGFQVHRATLTYGQAFLILVAVTAVLHLCFARVGWFYRYESYLVIAGVIAIAIAFSEIGFNAAPKLALAACALVALFALVCAYRTYHAFSRTALAVSDIYDQQYQMGLFAKQNLAGKTLVINDIGAVSFLSEARVLDLIGLGSLAPVTARLHHTYSEEWLARWSKRQGADLAITYPWFAPAGWTRIASWKIPGNFMSASDTVGFYISDPQLAPVFAADLVQFRPNLPARVIQR